jgi:hypothetical protein
MVNFCDEHRNAMKSTIIEDYNQHEICLQRAQNSKHSIQDMEVDEEIIHSNTYYTPKNFE